MHPCCNGSLQTGTKTIAIVQLVLSILLCLIGFLIFSFGGVLAEAALKEDESGEEVKTSPKEKENAAAAGVLAMIFSIIVIIIAVTSILLSVLLLMGAIKRNRTLCMLWFVITVIFMILGVLGIIEDIISGASKRNAGSTFLGLVLESYFLWVVWAFMSELKEEAPLSPYSNPKPRA